MSLYELESMMRSFTKLDKNKAARPMTDEEFEAALDAVREMNLPDVVV